jgi:hypothetical protein
MSRVRLGWAHPQSPRGSYLGRLNLSSTFRKGRENPPWHIGKQELGTYIQGGAVNRGLKRFFSIHRPSCHIEAYIRPEKYCFVWAEPLADHPFNFNFIFHSDGLTAAAERAACFADPYRR